MISCNTIFLFPQGTAIVDFTGTGHEVFGNINAPRAVTLSALIYCLRCMVGHDVPLNQVGSFYCAFPRPEESSKFDFMLEI